MAISPIACNCWACMGPYEGTGLRREPETWVPNSLSATGAAPDPAQHRCPCSSPCQFYLSCYDLEFLRRKKSCIRTRNRNKNVQESLRIGRKPVKTKIYYQPATEDQILLPRKGGWRGREPALSPARPHLPHLPQHVSPLARPGLQGPCFGP